MHVCVGLCACVHMSVCMCMCVCMCVCIVCSLCVRVCMYKVRKWLGHQPSIQKVHLYQIGVCFSVRTLLTGDLVTWGNLYGTNTLLHMRMLYTITS